MKVTVIKSDCNYSNILEFLHYHLDHNFSRELINTEGDKCIPRYIISEPSFEYSNIKFTIIQNEKYKKDYSFFYKYSELILEHLSFDHINKFINNCKIGKTIEKLIKKLYLKENRTL